MSGAAFLRIKKLKGGNIISVAARHNRRVISVPDERHDPARLHLNETLQGPTTADGVAQLAKDLMAAAGLVKVRAGAVTGLEIVISLPPNHQIDDRAYFIDCVAWAAEHFGGEANILSVDVHRDEGAPHCHILLLPLINGRLNGSDMVGNRPKLLATQKSFHDAVASRYGLRKAPARLQGDSKRGAVAQVLARLKATSDPVLKSAIWATVRDAIERDPAVWLMALGIEVSGPAKKLKTMVQIFTSEGKGGKSEPSPIGERVKKDSFPIGLEVANKVFPYVSVGQAQKQPRPVTPESPTQSQRNRQTSHVGERIRQCNRQAESLTDSAATLGSEQCAVELVTAARDGDVCEMRDDHSATRERDSDLTAGRWCEKLGEFLPDNAKPSRQSRAAADAWVNLALAPSAARLKAASR